MVTKPYFYNASLFTFLTTLWLLLAIPKQSY
ncbi:hypothetical protein BN8_04431 [Fibrisoma limi BUZ 3]|uniref:Uncharacterized protein n=1 Tax=Fibrisoma limi BUZ 3 TaxID=1185876 RepID=I2GMR2_9BACT|nr:hypothetical protein BN8_04431 [Fibrisoma limi BUZ 3]